MLIRNLGPLSGTLIQMSGGNAADRLQPVSSGTGSQSFLAVGALNWGYIGASTGAGLVEVWRLAAIYKDIAATAVTAGTAVTVWTPTAGTKFRLMGWALSVSVAGSIIFKYGAGSTTIFRTEALAAAGISIAPSVFGMGRGVMPGAANDVLKIDVTATATVAGFVFGVEE